MQRVLRGRGQELRQHLRAPALPRRNRTRGIVALNSKPAEDAYTKDGHVLLALATRASCEVRCSQLSSPPEIARRRRPRSRRPAWMPRRSQQLARRAGCARYRRSDERQGLPRPGKSVEVPRLFMLPYSVPPGHQGTSISLGFLQRTAREVRK